MLIFAEKRQKRWDSGLNSAVRCSQVFTIFQPEMVCNWLRNMARPERFELPTFWFVAVAARKISNLHGMGTRSAEQHQQGVTRASAVIHPLQSNSIRFGPGHKIGHSRIDPRGSRKTPVFEKLRTCVAREWYKSPGTSRTETTRRFLNITRIYFRDGIEVNCTPCYALQKRAMRHSSLCRKG